MPNFSLKNNKKTRILWGGQHNDILDYLETTKVSYKIKLKEFFLKFLNHRGNSDFQTIREVQEYFSNVPSSDKNAMKKDIKESFADAVYFADDDNHPLNGYNFGNTGTNSIYY